LVAAGFVSAYWAATADTETTTMMIMIAASNFVFNFPFFSGDAISLPSNLAKISDITI
jgi:hypothetical protein